MSSVAGITKFEKTEPAPLPLPEVTSVGLASMQVCVPEDFTQEQAEEFANKETPTGISSNWTMREQGHPFLQGSDARVKCDEREGCVHIMLDC